jgi:hypothetical protein
VSGETVVSLVASAGTVVAGSSTLIVVVVVDSNEQDIRSEPIEARTTKPEILRGAMVVHYNCQ